jgi:Protein of unknown function (DUF2778)
MTWRYQQSTGDLWRDEAFIGVGYSGHAQGLDNPADQAVVGVGPLPIGGYTIGAPKDPPDHLGPLAMPLTPNAGANTHGRSAFFMHGDNAEMNHTGSDGCIVMGPSIRAQVNAARAAGDDQLEVVV